MLYKRKIIDQILPWLHKDQVIVITGMRRTGKTTLCKQLLESIDSNNKIFLDLQSIENRKIFEISNYDAILDLLEVKGLSKVSRMYIVLDEVQLFPDIISRIKYLHDHYNIKFIITGSSSYYLKNLFTESLAGRKIIFELFPLDFGEFLTFKQVAHKSLEAFKIVTGFGLYHSFHTYYDEYVQFGGFPSVVLERDHEKKRQILDEIISSYLNIDVKTLVDFGETENLRKLVILLAGRVGTRLDISKLSRELGIAWVTVKNYLEFLEKTYIIHRLSVFSKSVDRSIVKAQKFYFCDGGLANTLAQISGGALFEQAVFQQLKSMGGLHYFALKGGKEIDFILERKFALEIKQTASEFDLKNVSKLAATLGINEVAVVSQNIPINFDHYMWAGNIL